MKTIVRMVPILLVLLLSGEVYAQKHDIKFERITIEQGLSQNSGLCIVQDHKGFMWFGTWDGLNKYDGYTFTVYRHDPQKPTSLSNNGVMALYEDRSGVLWIGTFGGGLNKFDRKKEQFIRYDYEPNDVHSLSNNFVKKIYEDSFGELWIATEGGLNKFDRKKEQFIGYQHDPDDPQSLSDNRVWAIYEDHEHTLWIGTENGLNSFDREKEQFTRYFAKPDDPHSLNHSHIRAIYEDHEKTLWIGTHGGGLNKYDRHNKTFVSYKAEPNNPDSLSHNAVWSIYEDTSYVLWIGTYGGGLNKFDRKAGRFIRYQTAPDDPYSLGSNDVWSIYEDRSGMLWVGTFGGGISKFRRQRSPFIHYNADPENPSGLSHHEVISMYEDHEGVLWIGTNGGGLNRFDRTTEQFTRYQHNPDDDQSLSDNKVWAIYEDHEHVLWLGTWGGGLNTFDRDSGTFVGYKADPNVPQSLSGNFVRAIYEDSSETLWIGTHGGGLNKFDRSTETFTHYRTDPNDPRSLSSDKVWSLYEDHEGTLWVGTLGDGLNKFDRKTETFVRYNSVPDDPQSLSNGRVHVIYEDHDGTLWIGTGIGLNTFDRDTETFLHYRKKDGLPSEVIAGILEDNAGNLWISTYNKLSKFHLPTKTFKNYDVRDNLQSNMFHIGAYYKSQRGEMFFGGINGFNQFSPDNVTDNPYIPPLVLTDFTLFNKPVHIGADSPLSQPIDETESLTLSYRDYIFSFEFAALSYAAPEKNRYKYKLEGLEKTWNNVDSTRRFATYTKLPAGSYVLRVLGSNNDGVWNEDGIALNISITPPWWETLWFRASVLILAISAIVGGYRWRVHAVKKYNRQLEAQVAERTQELRESEERFRGLSESTFEGIVIHDNGRIVEVNRTLTDLFGYQRSELIGQHVHTFLTAKSLDIATQHLRAGYEKPYELEGVRKDGSIFPIEVHAKTVSYQGAQVRVAAIRDITRQKQTEERLRQAKEASESANRAKSAFLANMSHELRTPLNVILGFAQLMSRNSRIPSEERENLALIQRSGDHLLTLINQVLDLSKIEAGHITLNEKTFDLYELLDELEDLFSFNAQEKGLHVLFERLDNVPQYIRSDDVKLRQVLINLLNNAVKFTEEGGVSMRVRRLMIDDGQSSIVNLQFEIQDTGSGIAADELDRLFEAFAQTESGRQSQEGTGLGLSISQKFVHLMGGDIAVKSEPGHGTIFTFEILTGLVEQATTNQQSSTTSKRVIALESDQPRYRILVVDDKADNRTLLVKLLLSVSSPDSGFEIREAGNGQEAVDTWQQWAPHLIWMDLRMPVMNGYEVVRIIREHETHPSMSFRAGHTKIIVLSASSFEDDRTKALVMGCDDFLRKPFRDSEIFDLLRKHLGVRFVYEEKKPSTTDTRHLALDQVLKPEDLTALPDDLRTELRKIIQIADIQEALKLVERIRPQHESVAEGLTTLLHAYRFDILNALFENM